MHKRHLLSAALLPALLAACAGPSQLNVYGGVATHASWDTVKTANPFGRVGAEYRSGYTSVYCEHISSVPDNDGYGINMCGMLQYLEFDFRRSILRPLALQQHANAEPAPLVEGNAQTD